jgi:hypothetical protein
MRYLSLLCLALVARAFVYNYCQAPLPYHHAAPSNLKIIQVAVVTRHGDRTPLEPFVVEGDGVEWNCGLSEEQTLRGLPGAPASSAVRYEHVFARSSTPFGSRMWAGNCTPGQLTLQGAEQCHRLGRAMGEIYRSTLRLIPAEFDPSLVYVRSSDIWRTRQSAMAHLLGLFPATGETAPKKRTIHSQQAFTETIYPNFGMCPSLETAVQAVENSAEWTARQKDMEDVRSRLVLATATTWKNSFDKYNDQLHGRLCHNMSLPVSMDDAQRVFEQADWENLVTTSGETIPRLAVGYFVQELTQFLATAGKTGAPVYGLFSAHDSSLSTLLGALGYQEMWPPYASQLIVEVWSDTASQEVFTRVLYNGDLRNPVGLCPQEFCPWLQFKAWAAKMDIDYKKDCAGL